jgi:F-type H+-transporting ATPase subunit delta
MAKSVASSTHTAYATSLLELAESRGQLDAVIDEVSSLREVLKQNPAVGQFLADPSIKQTDRDAVLQRTFEGSLSSLTYNFLRLLASRSRLAELSAILARFEALVDERRGKVEVTVTVAAPLDASQLADVRQSVSRSLGKDAVVQQVVDASIIGGMVLRVGDKLIDGSVKTQLDTMRKRLLSAARVG